MILPVLLIYSGVIPFQYRNLVLGVLVITVVIGMYTEKMSMQEIGIRTDNLKSTLLPYLLATVVGSYMIIWYAQISGKIAVDRWWEIPYLQFAFIPTSAVQEFLYRGFFQTQYQKFSKPVVAIVLTAMLYSFMHILWHSGEFIVLTLIAGLVWGVLWYKFPNLIWISASHSVLNFLINYFGYIAISA